MGRDPLNYYLDAIESMQPLQDNAEDEPEFAQFSHKPGGTISCLVTKPRYL